MIKIAIREQCERRGIKTAYRLQKDANVSPSVAQKWFSNSIERIEIESLNKLCNLLRCKPSDILVYKADSE
jgi:DNA-binding Xre family transcriptional regulator